MAASSDQQTATPAGATEQALATTETPDSLPSRRTFLKTAAVTTAAIAAGPAAVGMVRAAPAQIRQADSVSLTMWTQFPELRAGFQKIFDAFKKDFPSITITQVPKPAQQYQQIFNTALAAGELPDIFMIPSAAQIPTIAKAGQLLDLTNHVPSISKEMQIARDVSFVDGKLYDVVWGRYTVTMMYNKKMLAKFGLKPPATWDEWKSQCAKIKAAGTIPMSMAGDGSIDAFWFTELATAALGNAGYNALAAGKKKFTDRELQQTMQFVLDMVPYYQPGFLATKYVDSKALFATEKVVYFEAGTADVPGFRSINPNLDIGIFAFPPPTKTEGRYSTLSGLSVTVGGNPNVSAANKDAIYKFSNWCLSNKGATLCCQAINISPVVTGLVLPEDPVLQQMIKVSQNDHHVWYEVPTLAPGHAIWTTEGQGVFTGRLTSMQLLQLMQKQSDAARKSS